MMDWDLWPMRVSGDRPSEFEDHLSAIKADVSEVQLELIDGLTPVLKALSDELAEFTRSYWSSLPSYQRAWFRLRRLNR